MKPRIPAHLLYLPVRSVHCVFVVSYLTALVERGEEVVAIALEGSNVERLRIDYDMQTVVQRALPRFRVAIEAEVPMVMVDHLVYPDKS